MKDYLASAIRGLAAPEARSFVREYLQARILGSLQRSGAMVPLAFQGGTALRFLYSIHRFSEDLAFALERPDRGYDFRKYLTAIESELSKEGYRVEIKVREKGPLHSAFVRFPGLPAELDLSPHRTELLSVKVEIDTNPPAGAVLATTIVRRHLTLRLHHHDPSSLFAGKLHAVLQRPYPKGRDVYDLVWYLSDRRWPAPNLALLNNALRQTRWPGPEITPLNWREVLRSRARSFDWTRLASDVRPFLELPAEVDLMNEETLRRLLEDDPLTTPAR